MSLNKIRVLVCGGRRYSNALKVAEWLESLNRTPGIAEVVTGDADGADRLARTYCEAHGIPIKVFPALWDIYGAAAGPLRNQQMLIEGKPDIVLAFPGGRGTADMIRRAVAATIPVQQVD